MPKNPQKTPIRDFMRISQYRDYKRLKKYPLDIAFSEKGLIIDIFSGSWEEFEVGSFLD